MPDLIANHCTPNMTSLCNLNAAGRWLVQWRAWIRPLVVVIYFTLFIVVLPLLIIKLARSDASSKDKVFLTAGLFVLMALPISGWEITQHVVHYTKPHLQKHIIRILWMVPIYAINAWFSLVMPNFAIYVNTIRECYEAYVIYNFLMFLLNFLKDCVDVETHFNDRAPAEPLCIFCCLPNCKMGSSLIENCKQGILQYTVIRPITSVIAFICDLGGVYGEDKYQWNVAYPYLTAVNQMSQFCAMYCLAFFYRVHRAELAPMRPLSKFLCIKSVIFFSFFQGVIISILVNTGVLFNTPRAEDELKQMSNNLHNFLLCFEMLLAAVSHVFAFSHKPYVDAANGDGEDGQNRNCWHSFKAMWDVSDVQADVSNHFGFIAKTLRRSSHVGASELSCAGDARRSNVRQIHGSQNEEAKDARKQSCSIVTLELNVNDLNKRVDTPPIITLNETTSG